MKRLLKKRFLVSVAVLAVIVFVALNAGGGDEGIVTGVVERGPVERTISVSGFLEADQIADLSFPQPARLAALAVSEGDAVSAGDLLASAGNGGRAADRERAIALLSQAEANREELLNGLTLESREVSSTTVAQARTTLERTKTTEAQKIENARAALLSQDLSAQATDEDEDTLPPVITGSYICDEEGSYTLEVYRSNADSGYSIRYEGLESGVVPLSTTQPVALGDCGLQLQFSNIGVINTGDWTISIPNTFSTSYLQRLQALALAEEQAAQNIAAAEYALQLATDNATRDTAAPRVEAVLEANAAVIAAQADVARATALLGDEVIYAPFDGIVTSITTAVGEVTSGPVMSLVSNTAFTMVARVPEIDIRRLETNQLASISFDAASDESIPASVAYISPISTVIDGVSYFETNLTLDEERDWYRDGLNADIDIVIERQEDELRIPNRFITDTPAGPVVSVETANGAATTSIEVLFKGTDGFSVITGLSEGTVVLVP